MSDSAHITVSQKVANLPLKSGVYQFKDAAGSILYVGKAKKLKSRVSSYFQDGRAVDGRIQLMISKIADLEVIVTDSEAEALILENTLIKKYQPRYNIMYRDDKSYPYVCVTNGERPRVFSTRSVVKDGSIYYGPYDSVLHLKRMLSTIRKMFGLCTCAISEKNIDRNRGLPKFHSCFDSYLNECSGDMPADIYKDIMHKVERLLQGKTELLIKELKEEMQIASDSLAFEKAAKLRDSIESVKKYSQKMKMVDSKPVDRDIFAIEIDDEIREACGVQFKVREGKLMGKFHRFIKNIDGIEPGEILQSFVEDYYTGHSVGAIPDEIYFSHNIEELDALSEYLNTAKRKKVHIYLPQIGEKAQLIKMAVANAHLHLSERRLELEKMEAGRIPISIQDLQKYLRLKRLPRRIECFDNSNLQGTDPVAAMVCFVDAKPRKSEYKRFIIKTVKGPDDFASMKEIVSRRYSRMLKEKTTMPDLILIDGGKGQLSSAIEALKELNLFHQVEVAGLAKRLEEVFLPGHADSIMIPKTSSALKLIQRARDEAHRFAITFHREKRAGRTVRTQLTAVPGIGEHSAQKLLKEFGSVASIRQANLEQIQICVGKKTGERVFEYFKKK